MGAGGAFTDKQLPEKHADPRPCQAAVEEHPDQLILLEVEGLHIPVGAKRQRSACSTFTAWEGMVEPGMHERLSGPNFI
eukprot:CAMPEP_0179244962 /NCGR_PEP_ID=MMETSP0797-20121207/18327_1 /TAXON_ID=47934 /ORGANISM="Dinophysis acuminata, Strain DAEP01" /LENGTH=78 /DNA_ID=CAMNT_0020952493 /DNA_START=29 /DNA_END=266 /DNA_ORIENTATION=-